MNTHAVAIPRADPRRLPAIAPSPTLPREGDLLYRLEARLEVTPVGLVPEGLSIALPFDGRATAGRFRGARVRGVDHFLLRPDGVGELDSRLTLSVNGRNLLARVTAHGLPPPGLHLPPLAALVEPGVHWPDEYFSILGFSTLRAAGDELALLNRALATVEGWVSLATGRIAVESRIAGGRGDVALPAAA